MSSPKHFKENMAPSENESEHVEELGVKEKNHSETVQWVLNPPEPPTLWCEFISSIREVALPSKSRSIWSHVMVFLNGLFPILQWGRNYNLRMFKSDLMAGLTLASLSIPQSIGYAGLARLDPQYGLYTSVVPPLIYAVMGSSREIAIGPVAVISLLLSSMIQKSTDPSVDPTSYRKMVFTATFFAGVFQAAFGIFRLGFLVDFLSHAAIVGFMGGAAIVIGLQQLKGLLGITHFTNKTDVVSVLRAVWVAVHQPWHPYNFLIGCLFLIFILIARFSGRRNKKLFWLPAIAPLLSVVLSTLMVFLTRADNHGVKTVQYIKGGLNPSSANQLEFNGSHVGEAAKIGLIAAIVALTEAVAVGRSFASAKGYHIDGNKEMTAMGLMNITGSLTSCYVATGSFSRSAVNFSAGCKTAVSNIIMAITVFVALQFLTRFLYYTPTTILASIILSALPGLIDIGKAYEIWKVDKQDFFACIGAFFGVLFCSVEIGLLAAVTISFANIILNLLRPRIQMLGRIQGTDIFCSVSQYPVAVKTPGFLITRIDSSFLSFINANFVRDRILSWAVEDHTSENSDEAGQKVQFVIIDMSNVVNLDTSGIAALEDIHKKLVSHGLQLMFANPGWQVIQKLKLSKFIDKIGKGKIFFTVGEAVDACLESKKEFSMC